MRSILAPCMLALLALAAEPAFACRSCLLRSNRSADRLAFESPLVLVGQVESVRPREGREGEDVDSRDVIATVRVLHVVKGVHESPRIEIGSGPLMTGAIGGMYRRFEVGRKSIFLLPGRPDARKPVALVWASSVRPLGDAEMIALRIHRGNALREASLVRAREETPDVHAAAMALAVRMRAASRAWRTHGRTTADRSGLELPGPPAFEADLTALVHDLADVPVAALRVIGALDPAREPWLDHVLWREAMRRVAKERRDEIVPPERDRIRRLLARAGVAKGDVEAYLAATEPQQLDCSLRFPFGPTYGHLDSEARNFTTDFIHRYYSFDRGWMGVLYTGLEGRFTRLDPDRVKTILPALLRSGDAGLRRVGKNILRVVPGTVFADVVLDGMLRGDVETSGLAAYAAPRNTGENAGETDARLGALVDLVESDDPDPRAQARFWNALETGRVFRALLVDRARAALDRLLSAPDEGRATPGYLGGDVRLTEALRAYLAAAKK